MAVDPATAPPVSPEMRAYEAAVAAREAVRDATSAAFRLYHDRLHELSKAEEAVCEARAVWARCTRAAKGEG